MNVSYSSRKISSFLQSQELRINFKMRWPWPSSHWDLLVFKSGCWQETKLRQRLALRSRRVSNSAGSKFSTCETSILMQRQIESCQTSRDELTPCWWLMEAHWMWYCQTKVLRNAFSIVPLRRLQFAYVAVVQPRKPSLQPKSANLQESELAL